MVDDETFSKAKIFAVNIEDRMIGGYDSIYPFAYGF